MPRKPRVLSSTGIYHITIRSVNQQLIFEEPADYQKFLFTLSDCMKKYDVELYAYCLMDNHIHLLINSTPDALSSFFQSLGTRFVRWYNKKYKRCGHLFQERFYSSPIEDEEYFLATLMYIHNNPVAANACRLPSEYRWSSYNGYYGSKNDLVNTAFACDMVGSRSELLHFFATYVPQHRIAEELDKSDILTVNNYQWDDTEVLELFRTLTGLSSPFEIVNLPKSKRNMLIYYLYLEKISQKQISRVLGISVTTVQRICSVYRGQNRPNTTDLHF